MAYAVDQGRVFVTHNIRHFPRIHAEWIAAERAHRGIVILIGQARIGVWLRRVEHLLKALPPRRSRIAWYSLGPSTMILSHALGDQRARAELFGRSWRTN